MPLMPASYHSPFKTSGKTYVSRPRAGTAARVAWDHLTAKGPIESMRLVAGWWMCQRPGENPEDGIEACVVSEALQKQKQ